MTNNTKFAADVYRELHPLFKGLMWVQSARSTDETRFTLTTINIERDGNVTRLVATDGKRMHLHTFDAGLFDVDIDLPEAGLYDVVAKAGKQIVLAPAETQSGYPNWRLIISPEMEERDLPHSAAINSRTTSRIGIMTGVVLATDFSLAALGFGCGRGKDEHVHVEFGSDGSPTSPMIFRHDLGVSIVMPLRDTDDEPSGGDKAPATDEEATPELGLGDKGGEEEY